MTPQIKLFKNPVALACKTAEEFVQALGTSFKKTISVAFSGGNTPELFFKELAKVPLEEKTFWQKVHIFWVDERCVPPDHEDSNYGMTQKALLDKINIPDQNVHRILGEINPETALKHYKNEINRFVPKSGNWPCFSWIFLGVGADGHTASIFPDSQILEEKEKSCALAIHPLTGQKRITLTLPIINNAQRVTFLVTGPNKSKIVAQILDPGNNDRTIPAALIQPDSGILEWRLDQEAAHLMRQTDDE